MTLYIPEHGQDNADNTPGKNKTSLPYFQHIQRRTGVIGRIHEYIHDPRTNDGRKDDDKAHVHNLLRTEPFGGSEPYGDHRDR